MAALALRAKAARPRAALIGLRGSLKFSPAEPLASPSPFRPLQGCSTWPDGVRPFATSEDRQKSVWDSQSADQAGRSQVPSPTSPDGPDLIPPPRLVGSVIATPEGRRSARAHLTALLSNQTATRNDWQRAKAVKIEFSTSGGKGGQNLNKVNTKATLRVDLDQMTRWIPAYILEALTQDPHYAQNSQSIVIQASTERQQNANVDACWTRFFGMIKSIGEGALTGETSEAQKRRVEGLRKAEKARNRIANEKRKGVKAGRAKVVF